MKSSGKYVVLPAALCSALLLSACGDSSSSTPQSNNSNGTTTPPATQPSLSERTQNAAERAGEKLSETGKEIKDKTMDAADKVADKSRELARDAKDNFNKATDRTADNARDTGQDVDQNSRDMARRAAEAMRPAPANPDAGMGVDPLQQAPRPVADKDKPAPTTQPGDSTANLPGLPSVTGTDTSNLKTADAAAQRLLDKAQVEAQKGDRDHVTRLVSELQEMRSSLSPDFQRKVDELAKAYPPKGAAPDTTTNANDAGKTATDR